ncbi:MAG TPA: hypothetical protein VJR02_18155 [Pyrinomonadaceae bacterium]|nr:hypothetical protein [Pyrinomonadaceae bacterium]
MKKSELTTKRVAVGGTSDELYLIAKFRDLTPERRADVLKIVEVFYLGERSRRRLKLVHKKL